MPGLALIKSFLEQATAQGSRSTALRPLGWLMSICVAAVISAIWVVAPAWVTILFAIFAVLTITMYLASYGYCLFTGKSDLLRSESYSIQRLAIEKGMIGDNKAGLFEPKAVIENTGPVKKLQPGGPQ